MSALRNYRRSLSERRESLSETSQPDAKRLGESSTVSLQNSRGAASIRRDSFSEDEDEDDIRNVYPPVNENKPKSPQRKFSLDFIFSRKNSKPEKKKNRSLSTSEGPTTPPAIQGVSSV